MKHAMQFAAAVPTVEDLPPQARFSLRARPDARAVLGRALSLDLPGRIGERSAGGGREVLCLGPDEWVVTAPESEGPALVASCAAAYAKAPHAFADISDREVAIRVSGPGTLDLLAMGCPRDLSALAVGGGVRTILDGASVVIRRDAGDSFRIDVWRSFAPHLRALLETGRKELAAGL